MWGRCLSGGVAIALAVLAAAALAAPAAGSPTAPVQLRGANLTPNWSVQGSPFAMTGDQQHDEVRDVCGMGGNLIRFSVDWSQLQPGAIDQGYLARMDQVLGWAAACRIRVILDLVGSPCSAIAPAPCRGSDWIFMPPRAGSFGGITSLLLSRYPSLYAIEVWNEPNTASFWRGTPGDYAALVNEAVAARNALHSRTLVLAGALMMDGFSYVTGLNFLAELYQAGMRGQDGISIHPYSMACDDTNVCGLFVNPAAWGSPFRAAIKGTHSLMLRYGDPGGIYLTEFGFATCPAQPSCVTEPVGALWLARSFQYAARFPYVKGLTAFSMRDFASPLIPNPHWDMRSGILRPDLSAKPAFGVVRSVLSGLRKREKAGRAARPGSGAGPPRRPPGRSRGPRRSR